MKFTFELFLTISSASWIAASVSGINYLDQINQYLQQFLKPSTGENPCNPLYWYPRPLPNYCYKTKEVTPPPLFPPMPMPYPFPPVPAYPPPIYSAVQQYAPPPPFMLPSTAQMSFGLPLPSFGMPSPGFGMPSPIFGTPPVQPYYPPALPPQQQVGLVPGLPGIVSSDGGINILPFSDAYSDLLEKHKQKTIRKRLQKVLDEYDEYPYKKQKHGRY